MADGGVSHQRILIGYSAGIAAAAFDGLRATWPAWTSIAPAGVLVLAPLVLFDRSWNERKRIFCHDSDVPVLMSRLIELEQEHARDERVPLFVHWAGCPIYRFYNDDHPSSPRLSRPLRKRIEMRCQVPEPKRAAQAIAREMRASRTRAWLLISATGGDLTAMQKQLPAIAFETRLQAGPHRLIELTRQPGQ